MQTDALNFDLSHGESRPEPIRVRKRVRVKSKRKYKNNGRKQPLTNLQLKNWVTFGVIVFLLVAFVGGLFYLAYNHFPEDEAFPAYKPATTVTPATLE